MKNKYILKKFYLEKNYFSIKKYNSSKCLKIFVVSDLHYHEHLNKEIYLNLISQCKKIKPDFIIIPGDMIETNKFINNEKEELFFENIFKKLSKISPVIVIPGNHEISNSCLTKSRNKEIKETLDYFEKYNNFKNIYFLNNKQIKINNITFTGFNPRVETYLTYNNEKVNKMIIEDYKKSGLKMKNIDFNILITHSPLAILQNEVIDGIDDFKYNTDLVITGHLHDGYLPKFLDKKCKNTDIGLFITPRVKMKPGIPCRGIKPFGRGYLFISQGFRKYTHDNIFFNTLEKITANDTELLIIKKGR